MKLSIVIVNYNVKHFIEQCLYSVREAIKNISAEVWVVDNNSVDGSCQMIKEKFPEVLLIENKDNPGFSVANNQAIRKSTGEYVLLLNPDTIAEEDTFEKVIEFMDAHPKAGGLGVKMIDGKGKFLPESKRGLPTPSVAFYKIFGLSSIFSKSKIFSKYHLGYLDKNETHEIEILSGAFMFMRKKTLDKVGLLDENFFMYGEDIDLSYRIIKGGYKNYYFPETRIVHYKGESTKKGNINYVFVFYNAMIIFAKKHFSQKNAKVFSFLINLAIYFRASISIAKRFAQAIYLPLLDAGFLFAGYYFFVPFWERMKFSMLGNYPDLFMFAIVPSYIFIWLVSFYYSGAYDKQIKLFNVIKGIFAGTIVILLGYSLLDESLRFSRSLIFFGAGFSLIISSLLRYFLHFIKFSDYKIATNKKKKIIIVGDSEEGNRVKNLLEQVEINFSFEGFVSSSENLKNENFIGNINQIKEIIHINKIDEIIFCSKNIDSQTIINQMLLLENVKVNFKIAPPESVSIIGSNSIHTAGDLYALDFNSITKQENIRIKRLTDVLFSINFIIFIPIIIFFVKNKFNFIKNIFLVLVGYYSWVGYSQNIENQNLPTIKKGILNPVDIYKNKKISELAKIKTNVVYAKNYRITNDINIIFKSIKKLGRKIK